MVNEKFDDVKGVRSLNFQKTSHFKSRSMKQKEIGGKKMISVGKEGKLPLCFQCNLVTIQPELKRDGQRR